MLQLLQMAIMLLNVEVHFKTMKRKLILLKIRSGNGTTLLIAPKEEEKEDKCSWYLDNGASNHVWRQ